MVVLHRYVQATLTNVAMKVAFPATHPTDSTPFTVENFLLLPLVIKQITDATVVACKFNPTLLAVLHRFLNMTTLIAFNLDNLMAVYFVILLWV